jgi:cysteine desulfurase
MPIYLDNNATTQLDVRVLEAMTPWLSGPFGNPSSVHGFGRLARGAIDTARQQVAVLVGVSPDQVTFTSGGTEANNIALQGVLAASPVKRLVVSPTDHPCVVEPAEMLAERGAELDWLPVSESGVVNEADFAASLSKPAALVSIMLANNETGLIQDIPTLAAIARERGAPMHCDAVQAAGKIPVSFNELGVQLMSLSAHKIYGPKGVGALVLDKAVDIKPVVQGGGQERGLRAGTENVAAIVGFGAAAELALAELDQRSAASQTLIDQLDAGLAVMPQITVFADGEMRLPNTRQFALAGWEGEALLMELDRRGIAVSSGSACHSGTGEPSHVLMAMGIDRDVAYGAIRVSLGVHNTSAEIDTLLQTLQELVR